MIMMIIITIATQLIILNNKDNNNNNNNLGWKFTSNQYPVKISVWTDNFRIKTCKYAGRILQSTAWI